jgi:HD-like signal output (HDOD) protein
VIARAVGLRELLANAQLRSVVSRLQNLPSVPRVYQEVVRRIEENDVSLRSVGDVVSQDIGMTAKILQLVNSSFFGVPRHVTDPSHAVCLLGVEVLKTLILTVHIFSELASDRLGSLGLDHLWEHCTRCGVLARRIAELEGADKNTCDSAFMAGLLHDAGKLILAANLPTERADCLALTEDGSLTPLQAELQVFGATHAEVGAYLLGIWGLPDAIVEAVAFHHRPSASRGCGFTAVTAVHVADAIEHAMHCHGTDARLETLEWPYLSRLGVSDHVSEWQEVFTVTPQAAAGVS